MTKFGRRWWTLGVISLLLAGCQQALPETTASPSERSPQQRQLAESLETWNELKSEQGSNYRYEVSAGSVFGPSYDTTLAVQEAKVVRRDLEITEIDDEGNVTVLDSWSETGVTLGAHDEGAEPITVDERYNRCKDEVLSQNPATTDIYLEFQANGVLRDCSYISKNAVYDGGSEIITGLEFLATKPD